MGEAKPVVIVGGGVAGLSCAVRLARAGLEVQVLEREAVAGGNVRTTEADGFRLERGPHTVLASADAVFDVIDGVGLTPALVQPRPAARDRFIAHGGRLRPIPAGLWSFLTTPLLSARAKLTLATEPLRTSRGQGDETAARFFDRRFGPEAARVLAGAFIAGVYAGDPERLSAPAAFPLFWGFEQETGSMVRGALRHGRRRRRARLARGEPGPPRRGLFSLDGGLGRLTGALSAALGERCRPGVEVTGLGRAADGAIALETSGGPLAARTVVVATPPGEAARLLEGADPELSELLAGIPMAPVAVVHLGFADRAAAVPDGFGFLKPPGEPGRTLGVLFPSRLFEGRAPAGGDLLTAYLGGARDPGALELGDDELVEAALEDLRALTGLETRPALVRVRRHPTAIPQLVVGHLERMEAIAGRLAAQPGLHLAGNYLRGVGLKDAVASGLATADAVLAASGDEPIEDERLATVKY